MFKYTHDNATTKVEVFISKMSHAEVLTEIIFMLTNIIEAIEKDDPFLAGVVKMFLTDDRMMNLVLNLDKHNSETLADALKLIEEELSE